MIEQLKGNIQRVRERINVAAINCGREPGSVKLVGVTKYVDTEMTRNLIQAGLDIAGENRPQLLWEKHEALKNSEPDFQWHLIGHLQRNKVKRTLPMVALVHSVDSVRLLKAINEAAVELELTANVLLEVNVSGEQAKHGFQPSDLENAVEQTSELGAVKVHGLMCMAGLGGDHDKARREFACLRELRNGARQNGLPANVSMDELSMGMSGDFEIAIEEGATMVRVGSLLLEGVR